MSRQLRISPALFAHTLPIMVSSLIPGDPMKRLLGSRPSLRLESALATPVVLWGGWTLIVNRGLNMFTLISECTVSMRANGRVN